MGLIFQDDTEMNFVYYALFRICYLHMYMTVRKQMCKRNCMAELMKVNFPAYLTKRSMSRLESVGWWDDA
jgi:hypothetical protein